MGKQGFDKRLALANALNTTGVAKAPPPKKETAPAPVVGKGQGKKKQKEPEPEQKSKRDIEEGQRQQLEENDRKRAQFFTDEAAKKVQSQQNADTGVTYVEDKDTRKPKAVSDLSDYWKFDVGLLPFTPADNVGGAEEVDDVDPQERLEFLELFNDKLEHLLRLKFHVFWSQFMYDDKVRRALDSYLRFCLRSSDVSDNAAPAAAPAGHDPLAAEEEKVTRELSRRILALFVRLSRPSESAHEFMSDGKFSNIIYENNIFDIPKLIDLCAIYGDSNRNTVTKIVHSVFSKQPLYKDDFEFVVEHMLGGLHQCCEPLQQASGCQVGGSAGSRTAPASELSVEDCMAFLPDILSCFNAIFCFFPQECVEKLLTGKLEGVPETGDKDCSPVRIPLADLMVLLHDALKAIECQDEWSSSLVLSATVTLLCRLLGFVLGHRMAPRRGVEAFEELMSWLQAQSERSTLLWDLGKHGLENNAMEWLASGLVDDAQFDFLEQLCGPVLPAGERKRGRRAQAPRATGEAAGGGGTAGAASSTAKAPASDASASDRAKVREVREVVGNDYGEGFVLQCLLHFGSSVPAVVGAIFDGSLPPQLAALPQGTTMTEALRAVTSVAQQPESGGLSAEEKRAILGQAKRMDADAAQDSEAAAAAAAEAAAVVAGSLKGSRGRAGSRTEEAGVYDDDFDDAEAATGAMRLGAGGGYSDESANDDEEGADSDDDGPRWRDGGKGGKGYGGGGKGGGKGKGRGKPVQGQTIGARRKEENKARVGNHNRRDGAMRKMAQAMR